MAVVKRWTTYEGSPHEHFRGRTPHPPRSQVKRFLRMKSKEASQREREHPPPQMHIWSALQGRAPPFLSMRTAIPHVQGVCEHKVIFSEQRENMVFAETKTDEVHKQRRFMFMLACCFRRSRYILYTNWPVIFRNENAKTLYHCAE